MMKFCGLPDNSDSLTFEKFEVKPGLEDAYQSTLSLIAKEIKFLTLIGAVNLGKTHLAVATCHVFIDSCIPAKYAFTPLFLDDLRACIDGDTKDSYQERFNKYATVPLLVLDDIYSQKQTDWGSEKLLALINARYMARLSTIFTTNKSFEEINRIDKNQGERITSRLQRESWCKVVVL